MRPGARRGRCADDRNGRRRLHGISRLGRAFLYRRYCARPSVLRSFLIQSGANNRGTSAPVRNPAIGLYLHCVAITQRDQLARIGLFEQQETQQLVLPGFLPPMPCSKARIANGNCARCLSAMTRDLRLARSASCRWAALAIVRRCGVGRH